MADLNKIFIDRPELRKHFYNNAPLPEDDDQLTRVLTIAEMYTDFIAATLNNAPMLPKDHTAGWITYFQHLARSSPAIRQYWRDHKDWYEGPVSDILDEHCTEQN